jgi:hypothetical protein
LEKEFAKSIPYFDFSEFSSKDKEVKRKEVDAWICACMLEEGFSRDVIFGLFMTCIPSLAFHQEFSHEMLHPENAMHCSAFWLEMAPYQDQVVTHFPWKRTANSPETAN